MAFEKKMPKFTSNFLRKKKIIKIRPGLIFGKLKLCSLFSNEMYFVEIPFSGLKFFCYELLCKNCVKYCHD